MQCCGNNGFRSIQFIICLIIVVILSLIIGLPLLFLSTSQSFPYCPDYLSEMGIQMSCIACQGDYSEPQQCKHPSILNAPCVQCYCSSFDGHQLYESCENYTYETFWNRAFCSNGTEVVDCNILDQIGVSIAVFILTGVVCWIGLIGMSLYQRYLFNNNQKKKKRLKKDRKPTPKPAPRHTKQTVSVKLLSDPQPSSDKTSLMSDPQPNPIAEDPLAESGKGSKLEEQRMVDEV